MDDKAHGAKLVQLQSTLSDVVQKWQSSSTDALETIGALQNELASSEQEKAQLQAAHSTQQRLIQQFVSRERRLRAELHTSRAHLHQAAAFLQSKVEEPSSAIPAPAPATSASSAPSASSATSATAIAATSSLQSSHTFVNASVESAKQLGSELDRVNDLEYCEIGHEDDRAMDEYSAVIAARAVHSSRASAEGASRAADAALAVSTAAVIG